MATSTTIVASLLLFSLLLLHVTEAQESSSIGGAPIESKPLPQKMDCGVACGDRCKLSKRPNLCKRACGSCCAKCSCVPPGTSGNYNSCPCYANLTTRNQIRKCP
ncbi:GASA domain-containing protein [Cephalotus follicularis]|uniref:GASA domain-containing protein n=1 Tax=Cephalotus follicularis TaxID=3775 RepID=A0A1Q3D8K4_CEPFO|nr:GASA domain-containing protein [Cephalotus follicularis]